MVITPTLSEPVSQITRLSPSTGPEQVFISLYVVDINRVDINAGTFGIDCYLVIRSAHLDERY